MQSARLFFDKIHDQVAAFHLRRPLGLGNIGKLLDHSFHDGVAEFLMHHLAATKRQGDFYLIALLDESARMLRLELKIMLFDLRAKANFFDVDNGLFFSAVLFLFALLIPELAVIDNPANGRLGIRRNFHQIESRGIGARHRFLNRHDADLLTICCNEPYFRNPDLMIDPDKFWL